ncbi:hypothetical protein HDU78_010781 [Chytriomyces hyalinus]|nr:hypothetical protein HDU78_010781 [Chytriomyces hyalinus]
MKLRRTLAKLVTLLTPVAFLSIVLSIQRDIDTPIASDPYLPNNQQNSKDSATLPDPHRHITHAFDPAFSNLAIAIKTGPEVAFDRIPIQILTFMHRVQNHILIGSNGAFTLGRGMQVHDVVTGSYAGSGLASGGNVSDADAAILERAIQPPILDTKDTVVPDTKSLGWKNDANKNVPGFKKLFETYPDAHWYMMIDDDTYIFLDNLMEHLSTVDHETPIYAGRANAFIGCDNVQHHGDGPAFAHGGSGIVISNAAMKLLIGNYDDCMQRYSSCWAGDVRVGLCFRDLKVRITTHIGFNGAPPNAELYWPKDACAKPFTFHHLKPRKMQEMLNLEQAQKPGAVNYGMVYQSEHGWGNATSWDTNVDRKGRDLSALDTADATTCQAHCRQEGKCLAYSWIPNKDSDGGQCTLKDWVHYSVYSQGAISGTFPDRFVC